ncbi:MAG: RluA family pseudouridine synthase [Bacilli bacterium]|nr:RluA family pseudouridine synthase [Bacilli bacterium]
MNNLKILYEDNHIIVVVKPVNILSQKDSTNDIDMLTIIKDYIKKKYDKKGNVYLGLVHRLDRPVGGVMVFAKSSKAASRLTKMIKEHDFSKKYLAVINGKINKKEGELEDYLLKKEDGNTIVTDKNHGKISKLKYKVVEECDNYSLVDIELLTGRHHQIRVQFASRGYPLYGDQRYGKCDNKQIALWAYSLEFVHPVKKEMMKFSSFPPKKDGWKMFNMKL